MAEEAYEPPPRVVEAARILKAPDKAQMRRRIRATVLDRRAAADSRSAVERPSVQESGVNTLYLELLGRNYEEIKMTPDDKKRRENFTQENMRKRNEFSQIIAAIPEGVSPFKPVELVMVGIHEHVTDEDLKKMAETDPNILEVDEMHDPRFYAKHYLNQRQSNTVTE